MQMEYKRILYAYLVHTPNEILEHYRKVLIALLANCYNAEDLARDIVDSIIHQIKCIIHEEWLNLNADDVISYWYNVAATSHSYSPSATSTAFHAAAQAYHASSTPRKNTRFSSSFGLYTATATAGVGTSNTPNASGHEPQPMITSTPTARHHDSRYEDIILSKAYTDVIFSWTTDFLLYPIGKRVNQLLPRIRRPPQRPVLDIKADITHHSLHASTSAKTSTIAYGSAAGASGAVPGAAEAIGVQGGQSAPSIFVPVSDAHADSGDVKRPTKRRRLNDTVPRYTPSHASSNKLEHLSTVSLMVCHSEVNAGLEECMHINDVGGIEGIAPVVKPGQPILHHKAQSNGDLDVLMTDATKTFESYIDEIGEALYYRLGKDKEQLKQDIMRRDGSACVATREQGALYCTQIIPESNDLDRFLRFRKMVSTFFSGYYDGILESPSNSNSDSVSSPRSSTISNYTTGVAGSTITAEHAVGSVSVHAGLGGSVFSPSNQASEDRSKRRRHHPTSANSLRSPRNAFNLSAQWLRWFDEGKFVLQERGGRYIIRCLDPVLYHHPAFSRLHPTGSSEPGQGLELDIGAAVRSRRVRNPAASASSDIAMTGVTLPPIMALNQTLPPITTSLKQLPTPMATPIISSDVVLPQNSAAAAAMASHASVRGAGEGHGAEPTHHGIWKVRFHRSRAGRSDSKKSSAAPNRPSPLSPSSYSHKTGEIQQSSRAHRIQHGSPSSVSTVTTAPNGMAPAAASAEANNPNATATASNANDVNNTTKMTRVLGPYASGIAARHVHARSRNSSGSSSKSSKHSLSSLLNPSTATPLASKILSTHTPTPTPTPAPTPTAAPATPTPTTSTATSTFLPSSIAAASSHSASDSASTTSTSTSTEPVRRELWDVDTLDPNLVRLHEQIVSTWWATGLAQQLGNEMRWVDTRPLEEMNIFYQGEKTFSEILTHKLRLL